eukprot:2983834-Pleurochrysis_carterae.AAC.1
MRVSVALRAVVGHVEVVCGSGELGGEGVDLLDDGHDAAREAQRADVALGALQRLHIHTRTHACMHVRTHACMHVRTHARMNAHAYTRNTGSFECSHAPSSRTQTGARAGALI